MKKRILATLILTMAMLTAGGCGTKTLTCDGCGAEIIARKSSNADEDWILFCKDCEEDLFGDNPIVEESN